MTDLRVEVAVVGAGLMGAATAWQLARRGVSVALVEAFHPGHVHGSSHGTSRIVRRAYADPFYVRLTGRAFASWQEAEDDTGTPLLRTTGGLDTGAKRNPAALAALMAAEGAEFDRLFLELMIEHHRGAVEMATAEIAEGSDPEAVELARTIAGSQTAEMEEMEGLLAAIGG